ncbi:MAG: hypothetical protein AVDCRST_MAG45-2463 [uncultured Solirubrobacterales bacterium]|uniref:Uncharacterized protein n=1 Tax=uncultured Solirubrobacterales bacterium TaxID=768556 RepID=A0A6J4TDM0_9ACTN|nr:MAG: hypothetical protein AVDCRST_MAG45-2463 [uncultured Solirubrobacterales bacterium]
MLPLGSSHSPVVPAAVTVAASGRVEQLVGDQAQTPQVNQHR